MIFDALRVSRPEGRGADMSAFYCLADEPVTRLAALFPKSPGGPRVDDRRVSSGIILVDRKWLRGRDAPEACGPHATLDSRWKRWSENGIFAQMMVDLAAGHGEERTVMIDATGLKADRTATSTAASRSAGPRIGGVWRRAMITVPTSSSQPSLGPRP